MRFRRRSRGKGKREPLYWARTCFDTPWTVTVNQWETTCDDAPVQAGTVLFDPLAVTNSNLNDTRVTLRRLHVAKMLTFITNVSQVATFSCGITCITIVTDESLAGLTALTQSQILSGVEDIVDVHAIQMSLSGTQGFIQSFDDTLPWDFRAQRKLDQGDRIVQLYCPWQITPVAPQPASTMTFQFSGVISALWQRTLR